MEKKTKITLSIHQRRQTRSIFTLSNRVTLSIVALLLRVVNIISAMERSSVVLKRNLLSSFLPFMTLEKVVSRKISEWEKGSLEERELNERVGIFNKCHLGVIYL